MNDKILEATTRLEEQTKVISRDVSKLVEKFDDYGDRVQSLEKTRAAQRAMAKLMAALATVGVGVVGWFKFGS